MCWSKDSLKPPPWHTHTHTHYDLFSPCLVSCLSWDCTNELNWMEGSRWCHWIHWSLDSKQTGIRIFMLFSDHVSHSQGLIDVCCLHAISVSLFWLSVVERVAWKATVSSSQESREQRCPMMSQWGLLLSRDPNVNRACHTHTRRHTHRVPHCNLARLIFMLNYTIFIPRNNPLLNHV